MGYVMMPITMLTVVMMVGTAVDQMLTHSIALYVYVWRMVPQLYHLVQALQQPLAQLYHLLQALQPLAHLTLTL